MAACELAGLVANARPASPLLGARRYSPEDVARVYARVRGLVGHAPTMADWDRLRGPAEPSSSTLRRRYGNGWVPFLEAMEAGRPAS
jgi:hypothetical protein